MLKIKDNINLKELEKFGFKYIQEELPTHDSLYGSRKESTYEEKRYEYDDGVNTIEIVIERKNSDWKHLNQEKEVYVTESDYEMGVSSNMLEKLYDLIKADLVEKVKE